MKKGISVTVTILTLIAMLVCSTSCGVLNYLPHDGGDDEGSAIEASESGPDEDDGTFDESSPSGGDETFDESSSTENDDTGSSESKEEDDETPSDPDSQDLLKNGMEIPSEAEYREKIELLREEESVLPAEATVLAEMARCVTFARILDEEGVIFATMDVNRKAWLRRQILEDILWGETAFGGAVETEESEGRYDADILFPLEETEDFFKDVYGEEEYTPSEYELVEDGYLLYSYGDGEPWEIVEHMQFFEDEDFFLLTGPGFYEDNSGNIAFCGYADILFAKNPDSRYGVTLLYGRYREDKIGVASVETSSELPEQGGKTYSGKNLIDGDHATVWAEGVPGTGIGETVTLHLDRERLVYGVQICIGYTASYEQYHKNGLPTMMQADFGHGKTVEHSLTGYAYEEISGEYLAECNQNKIELDEPVMTDTIVLTVTDAEKGSKYDDTCISEVIVY